MFFLKREALRMRFSIIYKFISIVKNIYSYLKIDFMEMLTILILDKMFINLNYKIY